ncbi:hypothetical protein [Micromonospora zamorensis]
MQVVDVVGELLPQVRVERGNGTGAAGGDPADHTSAVAAWAC